MVNCIALFRIADHPKPAEPLRIYLGAPPRHARGMASTTDVEPEGGGRDEHETIVDPARLGPIKRLR